MTDRPLLVAVGVFAASSAFGAAVSVKERVRGEPFGIGLSGTVGMQVAAGWGSGLSAPWPLQALALGVAVYARPGVPWARNVSVGLGTVMLLGTLIEPVTWGRRSRSRLTATAVSLNLLTAVTLLWTGRKSATNIPSHA
jgi:hypothetical protein